MQTQYEKLGVFYLGARYDLERRARTDELVLYDSQDLTTHAVCVGMTGSGKTGLCVSLLEEAAIDGIPALCIDPKGDLANLLLQFPDLRGEDFEPWIDAEDARRNGRSTAQAADDTARRWAEGLADSHQDAARIARLRDAADFAVYTPGSNAGLSISIVRSFAAPPPSVREEPELMAERVSTTATSLLGLAGLDSDPLTSREHILIATILDRAWSEGRDLDLAALIGAIQAPPITRIGVLELEAFFPGKERFQLALRLNNLLASPSFAQWMEGEPLDLASMLVTRTGKPRIAIVSIAHLSDAERMFFVTLLLHQTLAWMRAQSGTSSLRALLYMDEIAGYFPPVANPPSKAPLLTLLKQARAFGLGVVLATQNPVDLDYKGLANCGTWFIGRLQTERDKLRLLDGLEGAAPGAFERAKMEQILSALDKRVFVLHNVHERGPIVFQTRFALSFLRGPLTRAQIKLLMDPRRPARVAAERSTRIGDAVRADDDAAQADGDAARADGASARDAGATAPGDDAPARVAGATAQADRATARADGVTARNDLRVTRTDEVTPVASHADASAASAAGTRAIPREEFQRRALAQTANASALPLLPPGIDQHFVVGEAPAALLRPHVYAAARVYFSDARAGIAAEIEAHLLAPLTSGAVSLDWESARDVAFDESALTPLAPVGATFAPLPPSAARAKSYDVWKRSLADHLVRTRELRLFSSPSLGVKSKPFESEGDFRARLAQHAREARDLGKERLRQKYAPKRQALTDKLLRARHMVEKEEQQARDSKVGSAISFGGALLGALLGRKTVSAANVGRATSAARSVGRVSKEAADVERAETTLAALEAQLSDFDRVIADELQALETEHDPRTEPLDDVVLKPRKANVTVRFLGLVWSA